MKADFMEEGRKRKEKGDQKESALSPQTPMTGREALLKPCN